MLSEARCFAAHAAWLMGTTFHAKLHAKRRHLGHLLLPGVRLAYLAYLGWSLAEYCKSECGPLDIFCDGLYLECRWLWTSSVFRNRFLAQYSLIGAAGICKSSRFRCSLLYLNYLLSLLLPFIFSSSSSPPSSSLPLPPPLLVLCFFSSFQYPLVLDPFLLLPFSLFTTLWYCIEHQKVMVSPDMLCKDGAMQPKVCPPVLSTPYLPSPSWLFRLFRYGPSRVRFGMVWFFCVSSVILISFGTTPQLFPNMEPRCCLFALPCSEGSWLAHVPSILSIVCIACYVMFPPKLFPNIESPMLLCFIFLVLLTPQPANPFGFGVFPCLKSLDTKDIAATTKRWCDSVSSPDCYRPLVFVWVLRIKYFLVGLMFHSLCTPQWSLRSSAVESGQTSRPPACRCLWFADIIRYLQPTGF